ncbi:hypothetical protein B0T26DRAFT_669423 [Lasiosphaeria miniovina]|uniref:Uncharacterized protein n=1 Tax=Lasiosphaeria miniovina TaxID=1954250 RepID=A0AA40BEV0_9PEZI|nr:uncharacterized protein B0T26DRAFT_669423 [Lasiosphaeria miniovina]KAK0732962.1 hypothetical protein B0T26DRAFT_669423 [Lasiosphaeria miniovina]
MESVHNTKVDIKEDTEAETKEETKEDTKEYTEEPKQPKAPGNQNKTESSAYSYSYSYSLQATPRQHASANTITVAQNSRPQASVLQPQPTANAITVAQTPRQQAPVLPAVAAVPADASTVVQTSRQQVPALPDVPAVAPNRILPPAIRRRRGIRRLAISQDREMADPEKYRMMVTNVTFVAVQTMLEILKKYKGMKEYEDMDFVFSEDYASYLVDQALYTVLNLAPANARLLAPDGGPQYGGILKDVVGEYMKSVLDD